MGQNIITISGLTKSYQGKKVVDNLSFTMKEGTLFALLGSNGAGKSTTIKMILSLVKKEGGSINIRQNTSIGYSPETPYFPPFLTGMEVLVYYGELQKLPAGWHWRRRFLEIRRCWFWMNRAPDWMPWDGLR